MDGKKLFSIHFTEAERATLESERARLGLRSMAEVIRHWIANASNAGALEIIEFSQLEAEARAAARRLAPLTNAKGEPKELPKPRKAFRSRLKGEWKAP